MKKTLLIFAKPPRMGLSKTRLARELGTTTAQRLNRFCHSRIMKAANSGHWSTTICIAPDKDLNCQTGGLWPPHFFRAKQGNGDLGDRLSRAFRNSDNGPVIVVGTDCPSIQQSDINYAFKLLKKYDAVFGPAHDGGFWLFGASPRLRKQGLTFNPVRWSSEHALSDMAACLPHGASVKFIHNLIDLDDEASYSLWKKARKTSQA